MSYSKRSKLQNEVTEFVALCSNSETEGFDLQAGETWIYPTNYSLREYQYNIIQEALFKNTLVSLPTGLGKTFIAAVVMYNFYRWYPMGKIIFMAPTRPLVKQQINACYNIMAIPKDVTAELTGTKAQTYRKEIWKEKRVFFITPQILQNDLDIIAESGTKIKCIVFDEAHKAKGNHAYCEVVRKLSAKNKFFRILALSATPGCTHNDVSEVISNLLISHIEVRSDDSPDVTPYIFERSLETIVVPLGGKLQEVRDKYMSILDKYTRVLIQHRLITGNCSMLTKGKIFMTMKDYQQKNSYGTRDRAFPEIMRNLNICVTLYHAYELLIRHGLRGFLSFFEEHSEKPLLRGNEELRSIMDDVRDYLGPIPSVEHLPDGSIVEVSETSKFGHPKFYKLRDLLVEHFNKTDYDNGSRVIVFCEYRESVMEAYALLLHHTPLIRPRIFLGQGSITQRQQICVINAFKQGECNTLVSTCIGEEGLDVGEVDLIVCFDISNKSPVRMIQRMGRTGRKRQGRVVILVTEGKEQQALKECLLHKQNLTSHIQQFSALSKEIYPNNPRMIPNHITPKCHRMYITVKEDTKQVIPQKRSNNLKDLLINMNNDIPSCLQHYHADVSQAKDQISTQQNYWNKANPLNIKCDLSKIRYSEKLGKVRSLQPTTFIRHSKSTNLLVSLLQFAETKRYNIPLTQVPVASQLNTSKKLKKTSNCNGLKQTDIRNIFSKNSTTEIVLQNEGIKSAFKVNEKEDKQIWNLLHSEISGLLASNLHEDMTCKICINLFKCSQYLLCTKELNFENWIEPDTSIFDNITLENLLHFPDYLNLKPKQLCGNEFEQIKSADTEKAALAMNSVSNINICERSATVLNNLFELKQSLYKPPNNVQHILKKCGIPLNLNKTNCKDVLIKQENDTCDFNTTVFDMQDVSTNTNNNRYNTESMHFIEKRKDDVFHRLKYQDALSFFKITTLEELFESTDSKEKELLKPSDDFCNLSSLTFENEMDMTVSQETIIYLPNCNFTNHQDSIVDQNGHSPILSCSGHRRSLKNKTPTCVTDISQDIFNNDSSELDIIDTSLENVVECLKETQKFEKTILNSEQQLETSDTNNLFGYDLDNSKILKLQNNIQDELSLNKRFEPLKKFEDVFDFCDKSLLDMFFNEKTFINKSGRTKMKTIDKGKKSQNKIETNKNDKLFKNYTSQFNNFVTEQPIDKYTPESVVIKQKTDDSFDSLTKPGSPVLSYSQQKKNGFTNSRLGKCKKLKSKLQLNKEEDKEVWFQRHDDECNNTDSFLKPINPIGTDWNKSAEESLLANNTEKLILDESLNVSEKSSVNAMVQLKQSKNLNEALDSSSDSDNFEITNNVAGWINKKSKSIPKFEKSTTDKTLTSTKKVKMKENNKRNVKQQCSYIDLEAAVSEDECVVTDSQSEVDDEDRFEESFVDDETHNVADNTMMHVHYMKSVKSPLLNRGRFKIPHNNSSTVDVYSQEVNKGNDSYINDSFCVNTENIESSEERGDMSELEVAELILEQQRREKRKSNKKLGNSSNKKRCRILESSSDDD